MILTRYCTYTNNSIGHDTFCTLMRYWANTISILGRLIGPVLVQCSQTCSYNGWIPDCNGRYNRYQPVKNGIEPITSCLLGIYFFQEKEFQREGGACIDCPWGGSPGGRSRYVCQRQHCICIRSVSLSAPAQRLSQISVTITLLTTARHLHQVSVTVTLSTTAQRLSQVSVTVNSSTASVFGQCHCHLGIKWS